ncbi:hypothetical protein [Clostridium porci]|uniref:Chain length determinant protein n=1 Tax=Clostridium porci TaxID=2605778 RepID=A0A7X2NL33_9CLOT|nr:hypothetical protein [Clostridium porci]MSS36783.1 hypothetical protein [Clostridium porci]
MGNQDYEQEIDLKELMFAVFHKWRGIILTAVIFGILFGGYKLAVGLTSKEDTETVQQAQEDYNDSLETYKYTLLLYERELDTLRTQIKNQEDYLSNSIIMRLSPYHKNVASADVFVKAIPQDAMEDGQMLTFDPADSILRAYESLISSAALEKIEGIDTEGAYLRELVTTAVDYEGNMLTIQTTYTDAQGAKALRDALLEKLQDREAELQTDFGKHTISFVNKTVSVITDSGLYDFQQRASNMLTTLQKSFNDKKEALKNMKEPVAPSAISTTVNLKSSVKYGVLGGGIGAFLSIFCICIVFLMSDKLKSEREIKNRFSLKILGVFAQVPKKKVFSRVDRWLDRMEGKSSKKPAEVYEIMAVNVRNYMTEGQDIMILGSVSMEKMAAIAEELKTRVSGAEIHIGQDVGISAETLRLLPEAGQIILVEERGVSKNWEIQNQIEVIKSLDKSIIGCVVL